MKHCGVCGSLIPDDNVVVGKSGMLLCCSCMKSAKQFGMFGERIGRPKSQEQSFDRQSLGVAPEKIPSQPQETFWWAFFSYKGRMSRGGYLLTILAMTLLLSLSGLLELAVTEEVYFVYILAAMMSSFPIVKRLHDMDMPGVCFFLTLLPLVNIIVGLVLLFKRGTPDSNKYGP